MLNNVIGERLGARFVLNMVDDDLTSGKTLGLHGADNLAEHLLFAARVPDELDLACFARRTQNANIEFVGDDAGGLGDTSGLREILVVAQAKENFAVLFQAIKIGASIFKGNIRITC